MRKGRAAAFPEVQEEEEPAKKRDPITFVAAEAVPGCPQELLSSERHWKYSTNRPGQARASKPQGGWEPSKL